MISVRNHLQPLSGNKQIFIIIFFVFTLQSCSVFEDIFGSKDGPTPPPPVEESEKEDDETTEDVEPIDDEPVTEEPTDTTKKDEPIDLKEQVNVAVILPFQLDEVDKTLQFPTASENSFELYKGIRYALNKLSFNDLDLNVYVLDNAGNNSKTREILKQKPFPDVQAVIGPLYTSNVNIVADYAKEHQIPFISPLSSSEKLARDNEYIISANATKGTRYRMLLNYIQNEFINPNVGIIYQPKAGEEQAKNEILNIADDLNMTVTEKRSDGRDMFSVSTQLLERDRQNVIIVPANDSSEGSIYMDKLMSYLQEYGREYDINIVGLSEWNGVGAISPLKYPDLNLYILDRYFINEENLDISDEIENLRTLNQGVPLHIYTLQGYDIMSYFGSLIEEYGNEFAAEITKNSYQGLQTKYEFDQLSVNKDELFIENKFINILQYKNGRWQRVN